MMAAGVANLPSATSGRQGNRKSIFTFILFFLHCWHPSLVLLCALLVAMFVFSIPTSNTVLTVHTVGDHQRLGTSPPERKRTVIARCQGGRYRRAIQFAVGSFGNVMLVEALLLLRLFARH
jgi:hypothetical protein